MQLVKKDIKANNNDINLTAQRVAEVVNVISGMNPNTIITWIAIQDLCGKDSIEKCRPMMASVKLRLIKDHMVWLASERGIGYRIVMPGDEIVHIKGEFERGRKTMNRSVTKSKFINKSKMSETKWAETVSETQKLANIYALINS